MFLISGMYAIYFKNMDLFISNIFCNDLFSIVIKFLYSFFYIVWVFFRIGGLIVFKFVFLSIKDHVERPYSKYWWYCLYDTHTYHVFSVPQLYTNSITLKISMVYRRHSGVQCRLKAIPNQSNVKARQVFIVLIFRKFVFQVLKRAFQGNLHTSQCYFWIWLFFAKLWLLTNDIEAMEIIYI